MKIIWLSLVLCAVTLSGCSDYTQSGSSPIRKNLSYCHTLLTKIRSTQPIDSSNRQNAITKSTLLQQYQSMGCESSSQ